MPPLYLFLVKRLLQGENGHRKIIVRKFQNEMWKKHDNLPRQGQISPQRQIECSRHIFEDTVKVDTDSESWKDSTYCPLLLFFRWDVSFMMKNSGEVEYENLRASEPFWGLSAPKTKAIFDHEGVFVGKKLINPYL